MYCENVVMNAFVPGRASDWHRVKGNFHIVATANKQTAYSNRNVFSF